MTTTRLKLISRLSDAGPQSIAALADGFHISRQAISKHLRVISGAGLATSEPEGARPCGSSKQTASTRRAAISI